MDRGVAIKTEDKSSTKTGTNKKEMSVKNLSGRVCYFSLTGDLALEAYAEGNYSTYSEEKKRINVKKDLKERLYFALLMFDKVILHCSDPLRSEIVLDVLYDFTDMIEQQRIVFIFSKHIKNIEKDYRKYIEGKVAEYRGSNGLFSHKEADSLTKKHINDSYYSRVIELLDKSPVLIRRVTDEDFSFNTLVLDDLTSPFKKEHMVIDGEANPSNIFALDLSLQQLLHICFFNYDKDNPTYPAFPPEKIEEIRNSVKTHLEQGNIISRSAIEEAMKKAGIDFYDEKRKAIKDAISLRMDILYCRMNCGNHFVLEFHPEYEYRGVYQLYCFMDFVAKFMYDDAEKSLSKEMFTKLDRDKRLGIARTLFISSMSDNLEILRMTLFSNEKSNYKKKVRKSYEQLLDKRMETYKEELALIMKEG